MPMCTWVPKISSRCARSCMSSFTPRYRSSGVISCFIQDENGWVPAAAILSPFARGQLDHRAAEVHQLGPHLGGRAADLGADLDDGLVQLGLHLLQEAVVRLQDLGDVRGQLSGLRDR